MVFYQTLLRILQTFSIFSTCRGTTWTLTIFNLSLPILVSQEPIQHLCSPKDIVTESCLSISCISHADAPRLRQKRMQMLCSFKLVTRNSWTACNMQNNKHLLRRNTKDYDWKSSKTGSEDSVTTASSGRELYFLPFSVLPVSFRTLANVFICVGRCWTTSVQPKPLTLGLPSLQPLWEKYCSIGLDGDAKAAAVLWFQKTVHGVFVEWNYEMICQWHVCPSSCQEYF